MGRAPTRPLSLQTCVRTVCLFHECILTFVRIRISLLIFKFYTDTHPICCFPLVHTKHRTAGGAKHIPEMHQTQTKTTELRAQSRFRIRDLRQLVTWIRDLNSRDCIRSHKALIAQESAGFTWKTIIYNRR